MGEYGFLILVMVPVILLAIGAGYLLATRGTKHGASTGREDRTEPAGLTGPEQHRTRKRE